MINLLRLDRRLAMGFLLGLAVALSALAEAALAVRTIKVGPHPLRVEVADNDARRQKGLMFRESLPREQGMLFVFEEPAYHSMWMKNTLIPLSVAFVDAQGVILNIMDMEPGSLHSHMAQGPAVYAIETNRGWFAAKKVKAGDKVSGLPPPPTRR